MNQTQNSEPKSRYWEVDGLTLAGLVCGPFEGIPVLALHGWLDNAGSFEVLAKNLPQAHIVAVDLTGHGLSDHRSGDATYNVWDDLPQLFGLLDQLGWDKCVLLGHSRGAKISTLLAAIRPERFHGLVTLDGMLPYPARDADLVSQFRSFLKDRERMAKKSLRVFPSKEDYIERRARTGEPSRIAAQLAKRALKETADGYEWRGDPRLSGASAVKFNEGQCEAILSALKIPVLNIWATPSPRLARMTEIVRGKAVELISDLTTVDVAGHHHWHMDEDTAGQIAENIQAFVDGLNIRDEF